MDGYRARIAPAATARLPATRPEAFGASAAAALGDLAGTLHREKIEDKRQDIALERNRQWSEFQTGYAQLREDMADLSREARKSYSPDHTQVLAKELEARREALLASVTDGTASRRALATLDTYGASFRASEKDWETVRSGEIAVENLRDGLNASANRTRRLESPADYVTESRVQREAIAGLDVSDKVREALYREAEQTLAVAYLQGRIDEDPVLAKAMLDEGAFDEVLEPRQVEALLNGADVEIRRAAVAARAQASQEEAELRDDLRLFKEAAGQGLDRGDDIPALMQRAQALGLDDVVLELEGEAVNAEIARVYDGAPPALLEQRMAVLRGKDSRSDNEDRELKWIDNHLLAISSRYAEDPVGFHAREGGGPGTPPPLDFGDPASIAGRSRWAAGQAEQYGRPVPPISKIEAAQLAQIYEGGREGEEQVMSMLNRLPPGQAMAAARLIDPADTTLPIMATLMPSVRNIARRGREAVKADSDMLTGAIKGSYDLEVEVGELTGKFERALQNVPPEQRAAVKETAEQIAAGLVDKNGGGFSAALWEKSLSMAMGATGNGASQKGGFASWGDNWFALPGGVTNSGFRGAVQRELLRSDNPPVNPDGSRADLSRAYPVAVAPGTYAFRSLGGNPLRTADGSEWRVTVRPQ